MLRKHSMLLDDWINNQGLCDKSPTKFSSWKLQTHYLAVSVAGSPGGAGPGALPSEGPRGGPSAHSRGLGGCWPEARSLLHHVDLSVGPSGEAGFAQDEIWRERAQISLQPVTALPTGSPSPPLRATLQAREGSQGAWTHGKPTTMLEVGNLL